ncbi:MAG: tautomerase family protein [Candidatus Xenobia bacterium]
MSHIMVTIPVVPLEIKTEIIKNMTETLGNITGTPYEDVTVLLKVYHPENAGRGGRPLSIAGGVLLHVDVYTPQLAFHDRVRLSEHLTRALADSLNLSPQAREQIYITFHQFSREHSAEHGHLSAAPQPVLS